MKKIWVHLQYKRGIRRRDEQINKDAWAAFLEMRAAAAEAGLQDMTLEEINAEIQEVRNGR